MQFTYSAELKGFNAFLNKLKDAPLAVELASKNMLTKAAFIAEGKAKLSSPIDTGKLRSSIQSKVTGRNAIVGTNIMYAKAQELGRDPYVIRVKNKKVLTNGLIFFGKQVNHPGFKGKFYMKKGYEEVLNRMDEVYAEGRKIIDSLKF